MEEKPWDFFMVVFTGTDRVQHFFWDDLIALLGDGDAGGDTRIPGEVEAYFRELDAAVGGLVEQAGPSTMVLIVSDHGFGPAQTRRFYVNVWLEQLGLLSRRGSEGVLDLEYWRVLVGRSKRLKALLRRFLPQSVQDRGTDAARSVSKGIVDWSKTRAYYVPVYFHVCGVEINVVGYMREWIVSQGPEYESVRQQVIEQAEQLVDPRDGRPVVQSAHRREDLYAGPYVEGFPDVILVLDPDYIGVPSLAGTCLVEPHHSNRPGEHRHDGVLVAAGPFVRQAGELTIPMNLLDVPPTILHGMEIPVPTVFDGRVLSDIFDPAFLSANPVREQILTPGAISSLERDASVYSDEQEAQIEERLRNLGYLD
jgi:predicted AlkP superfamily phosphohydrolase/phosphomutase